MAYIAMAYIIMAYIAMAYIAMAYIVMAYIAKAYIVMAYIAKAYIVMARQVIVFGKLELICARGKNVKQASFTELLVDKKKQF